MVCCALSGPGPRCISGCTVSASGLLGPSGDGSFKPSGASQGVMLRPAIPPVRLGATRGRVLFKPGLSTGIHRLLIALTVTRLDSGRLPRTFVSACVWVRKIHVPDCHHQLLDCKNRMLTVRLSLGTNIDSASVSLKEGCRQLTERLSLWHAHCKSKSSVYGNLWLS